MSGHTFGRHDLHYSQPFGDGAMACGRIKPNAFTASTHFLHLLQLVGTSFFVALLQLISTPCKSSFMCLQPEIWGKERVCEYVEK